MIKTTIARSAGFAVGAAMVLGFAAPAGAQTIAQLQAQIAALMAQLQSMQGGTVSAAITSDLTVGSTGSQVVALQNALVAQGYLTMPAGVAPGYFGALTKAAVMKWQAAVGLPATGYFGALSRAKFSAGTTTGGTTTGGTTTGGTTTGGATGVITTPGAEGTLTVTNAPVSVSTLYEGQDMRDVLAFKAEADLSDIAIQRVKLDLGTDSTLYRDLLSKVYLVDDAGRTLASADLNNTTVVRNGSNEYEITLTGFSSVVAKDKSRTYTIKADIQDSIESADITEGGTITLADNGVRGIDGAGIDLYSPAADTTVSKTLTFSSSLAESASLVVSTSASNPSNRELVASDGSDNDEADKVVLMTFNIKADKDDVTITDMINFVVTASDSSGAGAGATASTTYLYAGNGTTGTLIASEAISGSDVDFDDIEYTIPAGSTRTFTLAADIRNADANQVTFDSSWTANTTNLVAENTDGDTVDTISGSAAGNNVLVRNVGPVFTLLSTPTVSYTAPAAVAGATSSAKATFRVNMKAVGDAVEFGTQASTTYPLADQDGTLTAAPSFIVYKDGTATAVAVAASSTNITFNTSEVASLGNSSYELAEEEDLDLTIEFLMFTRTSAGAEISAGAYSFGLERLNWITSETGRGTTTFMSGETAWRTPTVTLP